MQSPGGNVEQLESARKQLDKTDDDVLTVTHESHEHGQIVTLCLNRPHRLNALSGALVRALVAAVRRESADVAANKVILLCGAGRAFCAGVDLTLATELFTFGSHDADASFPSELDATSALQACPHPMIACVAGACFTGGLELALACDLVLAAPCATFADTHAGVGIAPSWGLSQRLPRLIGMQRALLMSLSATPVDAATAAQWGVCARVVPQAAHASTRDAVLAAGRDLAQRILQNWPPMVRAYKRTIHGGAERNLTEALAFERTEAARYYATMSSADQARMLAFLQRNSGRRTGSAIAPNAASASSTCAPLQLFHCTDARSLRVTWALCAMHARGTAPAVTITELPFPPRALHKPFLKVNPLGTVPFLTDGSALRMTESSAICCYLAHTRDPHLAVHAHEADYARFLDLMMASDAALTCPLAVALRYTHMEKDRGLQSAGDDQLALFAARVVRIVDAALADGRTYLCADRFTVADVCVAYALFLGENSFGLGARYALATRGYLKRMTARSDFVAAREPPFAFAGISPTFSLPEFKLPRMPVLQLHVTTDVHSVRVAWLLAELDARRIPHTVTMHAVEQCPADAHGASLLLTDGSADRVRMTESCGVCMYLAEMFDCTLLVRADDGDYASFVNLVFQADATLMFALALIIRYRTVDGAMRAVAADYVPWFLARLKWLDAVLADGRAFLCAGRFTLADVCAGFAVCVGHALGLSARFTPVVRAYAERLVARPAWVAVGERVRVAVGATGAERVAKL